MEIYKQIRKMRLQGMSERQIAAALQISPNTVKKYWDGDSVPWERKNYSRAASVLTEDVVAFVRHCLEEDNHSPKKQHHTAKRLYGRLVGELGFTGGENYRPPAGEPTSGKAPRGVYSAVFPTRGIRCKLTGAKQPYICPA